MQAGRPGIQYPVLLQHTLSKVICLSRILFVCTSALSLVTLYVVVISAGSLLLSCSSMLSLCVYYDLYSYSTIVIPVIDTFIEKQFYQKISYCVLYTYTNLPLLTKVT